MIAVIQRVSEASVEIDGKEYSSIGQGYLVLLGIKKGDGEANASPLAKKIIDLRIFQDDAGKMNLGLRDVDGEVLVISQFTLCTDDSKSGNRPSFTMAEEPGRANELYEFIVKEMKEYYQAEKIKTGVFAAEMKVSLVNEGPVTIILDK
ncbi:MAG: D-tyrosyl-tRNA(Tyr) deacylase [Ignavibacteriae bacterium]|nr:D-tyrosyl-tRNA(Tyr) deacylase [Ignavibacteriota bacterium]MCB9243297.1 D-tyrosyl-tRNA(Tyr) deacylase [Ignavibacteriales bacterium]